MNRNPRCRAPRGATEASDAMNQDEMSLIPKTQSNKTFFWGAVMLLVGINIGHLIHEQEWKTSSCPSVTVKLDGEKTNSNDNRTIETIPTIPILPCTASPTQSPVVVVPVAEATPKVVCGAETCRSKVFVAQGLGGKLELSNKLVAESCADPYTYQVCQDLANFTGLAHDEVHVRMKRKGNFHFEGEHMFWNPQTQSELAWYYSTSVDYMFANAIHPALHANLTNLEQHHQPILDYSGGVGNNVLYLAMEKQLKCQYFGIGLMEKEFAQFRFHSRGLYQPEDKDNSLVTILSPWSNRTDWKFDPIASALPRDQSLGAIVAIDVLEHIPSYHLVVEAMVQSLRVGGVIIESAPFATKAANTSVDTRIHVATGGISMETAMGTQMTYDEEKYWWVKVGEGEAQ